MRFCPETLTLARIISVFKRVENLNISISKQLINELSISYTNESYTTREQQQEYTYIVPSIVDRLLTKTNQVAVPAVAPVNWACGGDGYQV